MAFILCTVYNYIIYMHSIWRYYLCVLYMRESFLYSILYSAIIYVYSIWLHYWVLVVGSGTQDNPLHQGPSAFSHVSIYETSTI